MLVSDYLPLKTVGPTTVNLLLVRYNYIEIIFRHLYDYELSHFCFLGIHHPEAIVHRGSPLVAASLRVPREFPGSPGIVCPCDSCVLAFEGNYPLPILSE